MAIDPVCGMKVDEKKTKFKKYVKGKAYYFCSKDCMDKFGKKHYVSWLLSIGLIAVAVIVLLTGYMLAFMGIVFLSLAILKVIDIKGFASMFRQYDPLAKRIPGYAVIYPFIELYLGISYLLQFHVQIAAVVTAIVMAFGSYGVIRNVLSKNRIRCACLGSKIKVPLTTFTIVEDLTMLVMAVMILAGF